MTTKLVTAALALATLTTASSAFAGSFLDQFRRTDSYQTPSYQAPVTKPEPRYHQTDYGSSQNSASQYERPDPYRPTRKPRRDGY